MNVEWPGEDPVMEEQEWIQNGKERDYKLK
jgi:hypothetical protein